MFPSSGFPANTDGSSNGTGGVSENVVKASVTVFLGWLLVLKTFLASCDAYVVTRLRFLMCDGSQNCYYDVVMLV